MLYVQVTAKVKGNAEFIIKRKQLLTAYGGIAEGEKPVVGQKGLVAYGNDRRAAFLCRGKLFPRPGCGFVPYLAGGVVGVYVSKKQAAT